jgi:hypothetical protein
MIKLQVERMIRMRGYTDPLQYLLKQGFSYKVCYAMLKGSVTLVKFHQLERLCRLLRCTPNDLLEWIPKEETPEELSLPLAKLLRRGSYGPLVGAIQGIPPEKIDKALELLKKLGEEE